MLLKIAKSHPELLLKTNQDGLNVLFLLLYNGYLSEAEELTRTRLIEAAAILVLLLRMMKT